MDHTSITRHRRWCLNCVPLLEGGAAVGGGRMPTCRLWTTKPEWNKDRISFSVRRQTTYSQPGLSPLPCTCTGLVLSPVPDPDPAQSEKHSRSNTLWNPHASFVALSSCIFHLILGHSRRLCASSCATSLNHGAQLTQPGHSHTHDPHMPQMFWSTPHLVRARERHRSSSSVCLTRFRAEVVNKGRTGPRCAPVCVVLLYTAAAYWRVKPEGCTAALTFTKSCYTWQGEVCPQILHGLVH